MSRISSKLCKPLKGVIYFKVMVNFLKLSQIKEFQCCNFVLLTLNLIYDFLFYISMQYLVYYNDKFELL